VSRPYVLIHSPGVGLPATERLCPHDTTSVAGRSGRNPTPKSLGVAPCGHRRRCGYSKHLGVNQWSLSIKQSTMEARSLNLVRLSRNPFALASWFVNARVDLLLVFPFILFFFVQLAHHQMWRDETNAWALAAESRTLGDLTYFARNEAHPFLWYVLLWIVSRATASLIALKFVAAVVGTSNYLVLGLFSPFSRLEKLLLYCSYYISFEYEVLARMYGVMLLLVLLYLRSRTSRPLNVPLNASAVHRS
jgi:hypothetical protein